MNRRLEMSEDSEADLLQIWFFIAQDTPGAADKFVAKVRERVQLSGFDLIRAQRRIRTD